MPQVEVSEQAYHAIESLREVGDGVVSPVMVAFSVGDDGQVRGELHKGALQPVRDCQFEAVAEFMEPALIPQN